MEIQRLTLFSGITSGVGLALLLITSSAIAQSNLYIYPKAGQNPEQQSQAQEQCHQWAVEQTSFDPNLFQPQIAQTAIASPSNPSTIASSNVGSTFVDDPLFGRITRSNLRTAQKRWDQYQQQQIERQSEQGIIDYNRAFISCMSAKDYEVR